MLKQLKLYLLLAGFNVLLLNSISAQCSGESVSLTFNMDDCNATGTTAPADYSEFVPVITESQGVQLSIVNNNLYRENPQINRHSCTPGRNGTSAVCVSAYPFCTFDAMSTEKVKIDVQLNPLGSDKAQLNNFSFYQMAPDNFNWINGTSGVNNYPLFFGVRIYREGNLVFEEQQIPTARFWALSEFDFSGNEAFEVTTETNFSIELLAYCPVGLISPYVIWDLEDIKIEASCEANCMEDPLGESVSTADGEQAVSLCADNAVVNMTNTSSTSAQYYYYVLTDDSGTIIGSVRSSDSQTFSFINIPAGDYSIYGVALTDGSQPNVGTNITAIENSLCGSVSSNFVTVDRMRVEAGVLSGGPFNFCIGDGQSDRLADDAITNTGAIGDSEQWVVTDVTGTTILALPNRLSDIDFENSDWGDYCLVWNLSYSGSLDQIAVDSLFTCITGCMKRSNFVTINKTRVNGGTTTGANIEVCTGDNSGSFIPAGAITLTDSQGSTNQWVITDVQGTIIGLGDNYRDIDLSSYGVGSFQVWHLSSHGSVTNLTLGNNVDSLEGCVSFSNPTSVTTISCAAPIVGGNLAGGPYTFCLDGQSDFITDLVLTGNTGTINQWVVTDSDMVILGLPTDITSVDFETAGIGRCFIYNLSHSGNLNGLDIGSNLNIDLSGDYALSNSVEVIRESIPGTTISGGPFSFCVGTGNVDLIQDFEIEVTGSPNASQQWIITDGAGATILAIANMLEEVNFDELGGGTVLIWQISHQTAVGNLQVGAMVSDLAGCYALSNSIPVENTLVSAGEITGGPFYFCVGDGMMDIIPAGSVSLAGNIGDNNQWVITDAGGTVIIDMPMNLEGTDYDSSLPGNCVLWNVTYQGAPPSNLIIGGDFTNLGECLAKSNFITLSKVENTGGTISGGTMEYCVGDGVSDFIPAGSITLTGNMGSNSQWIISDENGIIINLPLMTYSVADIDRFEPGICYLTHMSYDGPLTGFSVGERMMDIGGCYELSNSLPIVKINCGQIESHGLFIRNISASDLIQIKNSSDANIELNDFIVLSGTTSRLLTRLDAICSEGTVMTAGESRIFKLDFDLDIQNGELAFYRYNFADDTKEMIQYLVWGTPDENCTEEAIAAGLWKQGETIAAIPFYSSLVYTGEGIGAEYWTEGEKLDCLSSNSELQEELAYKLYPNPVTEELTLELAAQNSGEVKIELLNTIGDIVLSKTIIAQAKVVLDVREMPEGLYYVRMTSGDQTAVQSVLKF